MCVTTGGHLQKRRQAESRSRARVILMMPWETSPESRTGKETGPVMNWMHGEESPPYTSRTEVRKPTATIMQATLHLQRTAMAAPLPTAITA